jgi:hypothetical protein
VQDARDEGGRGVQEPQVGFQRAERVRGRGRGRGPEDRVVVGELGEEEAEEEGGRWWRLGWVGMGWDGWRWVGWGDVRQRMRKVAKELLPHTMAAVAGSTVVGCRRERSGGGGEVVSSLPGAVVLEWIGMRNSRMGR